MEKHVDGTSERRVVGWVRAAAALAVLAVVLMAALAGLMHRMDGQADGIRDDLDRARLRQYGVVAR
jgi:predicted Kef-type K+ transport protein